jgi:sugar lactone lactonase YvrE
MLVCAVATLLVAGTGPARAAGGWETHIRTRDFTDLKVTDEAVWCATAEAGLLRFDRATHAFSFIQREPGSIASNQLTSLAIDPQGRMWVGTKASGASLLTSDGSTWVLVNAFDGLPVDSVTTMTVAGDTLWIGTRGGIALWDGRQVLGSLPDGNTVSFDTTFSLPAVTGVKQMGDTLWIATPRGVGFSRISSNLTDWRKANDGLRTPAVDRLASDGHTLYALADGFVHRWDPDSLKWVSFGFMGIVYNLEDEAGTVLASTSQGVWWHRAGSPFFARIVDSPLAAATRGNDADAGVDPSGDVPRYCATSAGLYEEPAGGGAWTLYTPPGPPGNAYTNIVIDGPSVYAATRLEGIGRWDGSSWFAWLPVLCPGACPNNFRIPIEVFAMSIDRLGRKWVSCWGFAIESFDDYVDPDQFVHHWPAPSGADALHTFAFGAAVDSAGARGPSGEPLDQGGHWFGLDTDHLGAPDRQPLGLDHYDSTGAYAGTWSPGSPATSLVRNGKIRAVTVDKTGRIWIGYAGAANSGVDHFIRRPEQGYDFRTVPNTTSFDIWSLVAHGDTIWVLTDRDLRRISRVTLRLAGPSYETLSGRPTVGARLMDVAPNGEVYVGSEEGVRRYRLDGTFQDITESNSPLASNDVRAVAVDKATGAVWFGTAAGLNRFDPGYTPPAPPAGAPDTLIVFPNPATLTGAGIQMRLVGASAGYEGEIYDLNGRTLRRFVTSARGQIFWDGRDGNGVLVKPGVYFVRAQSNGREARARFVLLD